MNDNQAMRDLFTLPPISSSASATLTTPKMPLQKIVTGDKEVDAVLWLQDIVKTGNQGFIDKALEAIKYIKTPMEELGNRYAAHLQQTQPNNVFAALFATMGFGELENKANDAIKNAALRHEAMSRFGSEEALFKELPAERQCRLALKGMKADEYGFLNDEVAAGKFELRPALVPSTIDDCLYIIHFWDNLYKLRNAVCSSYTDATIEAYAHETYAFFMLGQVNISSQKDALAAFNHIQQSGKSDWEEVPLIFSHLISSGWEAKEALQ